MIGQDTKSRSTSVWKNGYAHHMVGQLCYLQPAESIALIAVHLIRHPNTSKVTTIVLAKVGKLRHERSAEKIIWYSIFAWCMGSIHSLS